MALTLQDCRLGGVIHRGGGGTFTPLLVLIGRENIGFLVDSGPGVHHLVVGSEPIINLLRMATEFFGYLASNKF